MPDFVFHTNGALKPGKSLMAMVFAGNGDPRGLHEIINATNCTFGVGSCVPCEEVNEKWYVLVTCELPPVNAPVPEPDPI